MPAEGHVTPQFVLVIGGSPPNRAVLERLDRDRFVIAIDSGLDHARALGLAVDLVVGDFDSVSAPALAAAEEANVPIERHPTAKDAIDTELGVDAALARGAERIVIVGGGGDRLDHLLAGLLLLDHPKLAGVDVEAWIGSAWLRAVQGPDQAAITGPIGAYLSILPIHGPASGVTTGGLRYPLAGEPLYPGSSRGVSNEIASSPACVRVDTGALLVIVPYALEEPGR
jgi:thiamine pyrophosphokinase